MSIIISLFIIGISLSMDTFSLSLSIGTFNINKKKMIILSSIVGIMHFFMPLIGNLFGSKIINYLNINANILLGLILIFIAIEMIINIIKKEEKSFDLNILSMFLISISVSLDSLSTGFGLKAITDDIILAGFIFTICSSLFTFMGLLIGKYSNEKLGIYGNIMGVILLIILGIMHLFK